MLTLEHIRDLRDHLRDGVLRTERDDGETYWQGVYDALGEEAKHCPSTEQKEAASFEEWETLPSGIRLTRGECKALHILVDGAEKTPFSRLLTGPFWENLFAKLEKEI